MLKTYFKKGEKVLLEKDLVVTDERKIKAGAKGEIVSALVHTARVVFDCGSRVNVPVRDLTKV